MNFLTHADLADAAEIRIPGTKLRAVLIEVADASGVPVRAIMGRSRIQRIARARQLTCYILRREGLSYPQIGRMLHIHHTTAMHAVRAVEARRAVPQNQKKHENGM